MFELHWWGSRGESRGRPTRSLQPEMLTQAKPDREVEHQIDVGPSLAAWRHDRRTKLNALIGGLAHPETDAQPLAFPCARDGQYNIGVGGGGLRYRSVCTWNSRFRSVSAPLAASEWDKSGLTPNPTRPRTR